MRKSSSFLRQKILRTGMALVLFFQLSSFCNAQVGTKQGTAKGLVPVPTDGSSATGKKLAILIGPTQYSNRDFKKLTFCAADMLLLGDALIQNGGYDAKYVWFLGNGDVDYKAVQDDDLKLPEHRSANAGLGEIKSALFEILDQTESGDTLLLAFSGHGAVDDNGESYLVPLHAHPKHLSETAVSLKWLLGLLDNKNLCKATRKIIVLDACHSGAGIDIALTGVEGAIPQLAAGIGPNDQGTILLASCQKSEISLEYPSDPTDDIRQGLFSHFIVRAFRGDPEADQDKNGQVTAVEAFVFAREGVAELVQRKGLPRQHPGWQLNGGPNFSIATVQDTLRQNTDLALHTLPGLNGGWWFDEMPLLAPRIRLLMPPRNIALKPDRNKSISASLETEMNFLSGDVKQLKDQLDLAASSVIGANNTEALISLKRLSEKSSLDERKTLMRRIAQNLETQIKNNAQQALAPDHHLLAVLYTKLEEYKLAEPEFATAIDKYRSARNIKQEGLRALCLADYAKLLSDKKEHSLAVDNYDLAISQLNENIPHAFHIYCLCGKASSLREMGEWDEAAAAFAKAQQVAEEKCSEGHPLRAHVYERIAWFSLDRWDVEEAKKLFELALELRKPKPNDSPHPFWFQNKHGQLTAARYLSTYSLDELDRQYLDLVNEIVKTLQKARKPTASLSTSSDLVDYRRELNKRLINTHERMADLYLYSCNPTELVSDFDGKRSVDTEGRLLKAQRYLDHASSQERTQIETEPRILYKEAIVFALRHDSNFSTKLKAADEAQEKLLKAKVTDQSTSEGKANLENNIYHDLAYAISELMAIAKASSGGRNTTLYKAAQVNLRDCLSQHLKLHLKSPKKRDEIELMLLSAGLLTGLHVVTKEEEDSLKFDIEQFETLVEHLNASPPQLRRYLRPYYCTAIQSLAASRMPDHKMMHQLVLACKYGQSQTLNPNLPVVIVYADQASIFALAREVDSDQWAMYPHCFGKSAENVYSVQNKDLDELFRRLNDAGAEVQLFWNDPDLRIGENDFPRGTHQHLHLKFLPEP